MFLFQVPPESSKSHPTSSIHQPTNLQQQSSSSYHSQSYLSSSSASPSTFSLWSSSSASARIDPGIAAIWARDPSSMLLPPHHHPAFSSPPPPPHPTFTPLQVHPALISYGTTTTSASTDATVETVPPTSTSLPSQPCAALPSSFAPVAAPDPTARLPVYVHPTSSPLYSSAMQLSPQGMTHPPLSSPPILPYSSSHLNSSSPPLTHPSQFPSSQTSSSSSLFHSSHSHHLYPSSPPPMACYLPTTTTTTTTSQTAPPRPPPPYAPSGSCSAAPPFSDPCLHGAAPQPYPAAHVFAYAPPFLASYSVPQPPAP
eukprot:GHVS01085460.1.p1 GENE.GHVS01085460.1~~GHVS01085460.1.p1  ORF type:complete len:313 (+),score=88.63 GHVS01085460.1:187-1125(+)